MSAFTVNSVRMKRRIERKIDFLEAQTVRVSDSMHFRVLLQTNCPSRATCGKPQAFSIAFIHMLIHFIRAVLC
jgi:hypothetical protein